MGAEQDYATIWDIWAKVSSKLTPAIQNYAQNLLLLKKSKDDCQVDAALLKASDEDREANIEGDIEMESI